MHVADLRARRRDYRGHPRERRARSGHPRRAGLHFLLPQRTISDEIAANHRCLGASRSAAREEARDWVRQLGLGGFERYFSQQLSGSMCKRVTLALALIKRLATLLMGESLGALASRPMSVLTNPVILPGPGR
ncbi:hypothetical protein GQ466_05200 [Actinomadura rayongensis]|uniref:Uncharacterized protein n=1 Tax=Actinomadura rayongensis TaxID=1429076 RepID=A0A6I4W8L7_9ACTN|nr:hypothetical protein [Actinomadura rayongensis]